MENGPFIQNLQVLSVWRSSKRLLLKIGNNWPTCGKLSLPCHAIARHRPSKNRLEKCLFVSVLCSDQADQKQQSLQAHPSVYYIYYQRMDMSYG
jgi:hypothetical protein